MSAVKIPVTGGGFTLVDSDIAEKLKNIRIFKCSHKKYAAININRSPVPLHQFVLPPEEGLETDHINGNTFDNRRENLRHATKSQNLINMHKVRFGYSGYRWIYLDKKKRVCKISYRILRKHNHIGYLYSRHIAALFADDIMFARFGRFVVLNFRKEIQRKELTGFLESTKGRIFNVVFSRRSDGKQREMTCRTGVKKNQNGGSLSFDPDSQNLLSVYDVKKRSYRFIPLERVICIKFAKTKYRIAG
jgi:hypothetical protein